MTLDGKVILVTDGAGSFGRKFTEICLKEHNPEFILLVISAAFRGWYNEGHIQA